jgi:DNA-binding CsgD family transcriptional regulator
VKVTPFVGRDVELATLRQLLIDVAGRGRGQMVLISGEAGVGKTRLTAELASEASTRGFLSLVGSCRDMEETLPYLPVVDVVEGAHRELSADEFRKALGDSAAEVARTMPELRRWLPDIGPPLDLPPEQARRYLHVSLTEFLERASSWRPLVVILEDLHWGDVATLKLLEHLVPRLGGMALLLMATYREPSAERNDALVGVLEELLRKRLAQVIELEPFSEAETALMMTSLSGSGPPPAALNAMQRETEGNAFFIEEVFNHWTDEGRIVDAAGRWRAGPTFEELSIPRTVRLVLERRLSRLSAAARHLLEAAAVLGPTFDLEPLAETAEIEGGALAQAIEEAEQSHLIAAEKASTFRFAHELVRRTLLAVLSSVHRQRLHLRAAHAIERLCSDRLDEHAADLVRHLSNGGPGAEPAKLLRYLIMAGDQALEAAAYEDALRHYEAAAGLQPKDDERARAELLVRAGLADRSLGRWDAAINAWQEAIGCYERLSDSEAVGHICAEMAESLMWGGRFPESAQAVDRGLRSLGDVTTSDRVRLLCWGARVSSFGGNYEMGESLATQAVTLATELEDDRLRALSLCAQTLHNWSWCLPARALANSELTMSLARSAGSPWELADALAWVQFVNMDAGRFAEVRRIGLEVEPVAAKIGHYGALMLCGRSLLTADAAAGDFDAAKLRAQADLRLCTETGLPWSSDSLTWLGIIAFWRGDWPSAAAHFERGVKTETRGTLAGAPRAFAFLLAAHLGDERRCRQMLDEMASVFPTPGHPASLGAWTTLANAIEGLWMLHDPAPAGALYPLVQEAIAAGNIVLGHGIRLAESVAGVAAAAAGQWDVAESHFERALRQAFEIPHRLDQPETRRLYASMLAARGGDRDHERARALLQDALFGYRDLRMPRHEEMTARLLRGLGVPTSRKSFRSAQKAGPDQLTSREVEVLELLAAGHTSKEIATRLYLSVGTVQRHVANLYTKIGARNRAEATAYALRRRATAQATRP